MVACCAPALSAAAPGGVVGLRRWTVLLERDSDVAAVRERALVAGVDAPATGDGVLLHDPWGHPVLFAPAL